MDIDENSRDILKAALDWSENVYKSDYEMLLDVTILRADLFINHNYDRIATGKCEGCCVFNIKDSRT